MKYSITGVAVLEAVEGAVCHWPNLYSILTCLYAGFAVEALPHMNSLLNARPDGFDSMERAIEWQYVAVSSSESRF
jgi:protein phosphatase methylesterase 1